MLFHPARYFVQTRLTILFLAIIGLTLASLNSATVRFAVILRDRAKSDLTTLNDSVPDNMFIYLMNQVLGDTVLAALFHALFAIFGAVLAAHPRWLGENNKVLVYYVFVQLLLGFVTLVTGAYLADHVHGFQISFEQFDNGDNLPYYSIMYYGGISQAAYGCLVIFMTLAPSMALLIFDHLRRRWERADDAAHQSIESA